jgi:hypothetical protein
MFRFYIEVTDIFLGWEEGKEGKRERLKQQIAVCHKSHAHFRLSRFPICKHAVSPSFLSTK